MALLASVLSALWLVLFALGVVLVVLFYFQQWLLYVPYFPPDSRTAFITPHEVGVDPHLVQELSLPTPDGELLQAWLIRYAPPVSGRKRVSVLFLHENAGNLSHRLENVKALQSHCPVDVFLLSYRGYGASTGTPSETGLLMDALTALKWMHAHHHGHVVIFGRSLGGAVALSLAALSSRPPILGVIVENTFTGVADMARKLFPALFPLVSFALLGSPWRSIRAVQRKELRTLPMLFLCGLADELVPPELMRRLYEACVSEHKEWREYSEGQHMDTWMQPHYWLATADFLEKLRPIDDE